MQLKSIKEVKNLEGKKVLLRVAYDVPLKEQGNDIVVSDDRRIRETLPTIKYLLQKKCSIVLLSWLKRPGGKVVEKYRMDPVAKKLSEILKLPVRKLNDCIGPKVFAEIKNLKPGEILMLENVRFYHQEEENSRPFAKLLVHGLDLIVFDAFAQAHRVHSSTVGILKYLPVYAGFLFEKEVNALSAISSNPQKPFVVILGGAKISDKIAVLQRLVKSADKVLIGGGVANVFFKALGVPVGKSFLEDVFVDKARRRKINFVKLAKKIYQNNKTKIVLPIDMISANQAEVNSLIEVVDFIDREKIKKDWKFLDIGPKSANHFILEIKKAKTIFWNGPMGVFEIPKFAQGTKRIALAVANSKAISIIGGGDTETVALSYNLAGKFTHISTGGGASLEFLAGNEFPVLKYLKK